MSESNPFPKIEIFPKIERVLEVAGKIGKFLFTSPEVHPYMSNHYRGASEMLDSHLIEPSDGEAIESGHEQI